MVDKELDVYYRNCSLCPRNCGIDRTINKGACGGMNIPSINLSMLHKGEEPIISGVSPARGSGTIFFEGCYIRCPFCQNYSISRGETLGGERMNSAKLSELMLSLQDMGAYNINLVTPMHYAPTIAAAITKARSNGLNIPIIINSGGYESISSIKLLDGLVDIFIPDMKFYSSKLSMEAIGLKDYPIVAKAAIATMFEAVGPISLNENGMLSRGVIVRHLMMPGKLFDTKKIIDYLLETYNDKIYISLMNQYTVMPSLPINAPSYMKTTLQPSHYRAMVDYLEIQGARNIFLQDMSSIGPELIPDFK